MGCQLEVSVANSEELEAGRTRREKFLNVLFLGKLKVLARRVDEDVSPGPAKHGMTFSQLTFPGLEESCPKSVPVHNPAVSRDISPSWRDALKFLAAKQNESTLVTEKLNRPHQSCLVQVYCTLSPALAMRAWQSSCQGMFCFDLAGILSSWACFLKRMDSTFFARA